MQTQAADRTRFDERWPVFLGLVDAAGRAGAKLIVLPEGTVPSYVVGTEAVPEELISRTRSDLATLAQRHGATIVYGTARTHDGRQYNTASVLGPDGSDLGFAAKQFLWHFDRKWFAEGGTLEPIDTPVGRLGVLVCADNRIPTIPATLVERGAELLVLPTAWVTSGREAKALENVQADLMINVRAHENGVPFVACNKSGVEEQSVAYCGKSAIVAADGHFVARAGEREQTVLSGEITVGGAHATHNKTLAANVSPNDNLLPKARVAFTCVSDPYELKRFEALATLEDANVVISPDDGEERIVERNGVRYAILRKGTFCNPRGLVEARLAGVDLFVWADGASQWEVNYARTRALELRAFIVVFDTEHSRSYAVDPDGMVVAGTFDDFKMAAFAYDRARAANGFVAPSTDIFAGLRTAEAIRAETSANATKAGAPKAAATPSLVPHA